MDAGGRQGWPCCPLSTVTEKEDLSMKAAHWLGMATLLSLSIPLAGCSGDRKGSEEKQDKVTPADRQGQSADKVKVNLTKLDEDDRRLAESQKRCAIEQDNLL